MIPTVLARVAIEEVLRNLKGLWYDHYMIMSGLIGVILHNSDTLTGRAHHDACNGRGAHAILI